MKKESEFPFERARQVTPEENEKFRKAIASQFNLKLRKRGRPAKDENELYEQISIRLHPEVLAWAKKEAEKQGIGYQTVINQTLLQQII
ncbi:MAG: BrnA antitoxin family protein [Cyanobacterium sp. T60_A2020_053]|nr:BrnA antitoxin family protein [Cyanobacterium sp. T60_A2020_053]